MTPHPARHPAAPDPNAEAPRPWLGLVTILLTLAGWTAAPLLIREFTTDVDPWTSNGWRYGFAALLWLPLVIWQTARGTMPKGLWKVALIPGLINAASQVAFTKAHYLVQPGLLTFGLRVQIVCVAVGAALMFPAERKVIRRPLFLVGLVMVLGGTLSTAALQPGITGDASAVGVGLSMLAGAGYAGYALAVRKFMHGVNPMTAFAVISQITAACMVALMLPFGERMGATALDMTAPRFGLFFLSAVIGIAAGHVLYYISIARLGVAVSTGVVQCQPFTVSVASYYVFGEVLRPIQWATGSVAVLGAVLMLVVQHVASRREHPLFQPSPLDDAPDFADLPPDADVAIVTQSPEGEPPGAR
jgi:drug/metabolite transporter (DMT)-like permease